MTRTCLPPPTAYTVAGAIQAAAISSTITVKNPLTLNNSRAASWIACRVAAAYSARLLLLAFPEDPVDTVMDMFHAGPSSDVIRDILPCSRDEHPRGDCTDLLARVRQVRDELLRQEQNIAERRRRLDTYLANGYESHPARSLPVRTEAVP